MTTVVTIPEDLPVYTKWNLATYDLAVVSEHGGVVLVDKPRGWTSFDVVAKCRNLLRIKKVGHTGTLDPMATGLLLLCLAKATKLADALQAGTKQYTGTITLGSETTTDDAEGDVVSTVGTGHVSVQMILDAVQSFRGEISQTPPMYSAKKVDGSRLYKMARRGVEVQRQATTVHVHEFELLEIDIPQIRFRIVCSKGTYIRSIARDLGRLLKTGAHLSELRRTKSGQYDVSDALTIEQIAQFSKSMQPTPAVDSSTGNP